MNDHSIEDDKNIEEVEEMPKKKGKLPGRKKGKYCL